MTTVVPVILAGGSGTRLWPLSREDRPKQFLPLAGPDSLLQRTVRRALALARPDQVLTVADEHHLPLLQEELGTIDAALVDGILLEPVGRNTAAALSYAALVAEERWPGALLWVMPADHVVEDEPALQEALARALAAAATGWIVTFGIEPERPETGFGYIKQGRPLPGVEGVYGAAEFIEKPPLAEAERMVAGQRHLWNSGMLVTGARTFLDELATHAPALHRAVEDALSTRKQDQPTRVDASSYGRIPAEPFDKAVLERSDRVAVVPCNIGWSDVGTWNNLWELMPHDASDNVVHGAVIVDRSSNCLLHASSRLIACTGIRDIAVIETGDAVLIADRSDAAGIRRIMQTLKAQNRPEIASDPGGLHPWGCYRVLHDAPELKIRELVVAPGRKLSIELHAGSPERWVVTRGAARVSYGNRMRDVPTGGSIEIPPRVRHRLENPGTEPLHLIEIRYAGHSGDDTIRIEEVGDRVRAAS